MNFEQILLIFLKKRLKSVFFFKSEFHQNIHDFYRKKHEFGTDSIDFLKKKLKSMIFPKTNPILSKYL